MARYRSNCFALTVLCVALATARTHAAPIEATASVCALAQAVAWTPEASAAKRDDDAPARLAEAARDLRAAEQAIRDDPSLAAVFGPMLRQARANLEAGMAAVAATMPARPAPEQDGEPRTFKTGTPMAEAACEAGARSDNRDLHARRARHTKPMIWV